MDRDRLLDRATQAHQQSRYAEAEALYREILAAWPKDFDALNRLGVLKLHVGAYKEARALLEEAIAVNPASASALSNLGTVLLEQGLKDEALNFYNAAVALQPGDGDFQFNLARLYLLLGRPEDAAPCLEEIVRDHPIDLEIVRHYTLTLLRLKRYADVVDEVEKAMAIAPDDVVLLNDRNISLFKLGRFEEATAGYDRVLSLQPDHPGALAMRMFLAARICDWPAVARYQPAYLAACGRSDYNGASWPLLAVSDDPVAQQAAASALVGNANVVSHEPLPATASRGEARKVRLGYLSADLNQHPVAQLIVELLELHDRGRFEVHGFAATPADGTALGTRIRKAFDVLTDVSSLSDEALARSIADKGIDILVDLGGHTNHSRIMALLQRPAPIQVTYLGYPATTGAPFIDYAIVDRFVVPADSEQHFSEKLAVLPDSFQPNDRQRSIAPRTPFRSEFGLPMRGFVFCGLNNSYKINAEVFDVWMRLLQATPRSVLWLFADGGVAQENLRREASARGVNPERLVFAPRVPQHEDHLARLRLADLFLDTWPYNAHTTASEALWAGLPLLTFCGRSYAARVAGSLLHGVGLPELITDSPQAYEALALELATDPERLADIRHRLALHVKTARLFDTDRLRQHIEAAYLHMWQRHSSGQQPHTFVVPPVDGRGD